jgi:phosphonate transport system substrate-binding protein
MKTFFATVALAAVTGCMICTANPAMAAPKAACERPQRLRFSFVPQGRDIDQQSAFGPLVEELRERLKMPVDVIVPTSYGGVIEGSLPGPSMWRGWGRRPT